MEPVNYLAIYRDHWRRLNVEYDVPGWIICSAIVFGVAWKFVERVYSGAV